MTQLYPDEYPNMDSFGGWLVVNLFLQRVRATGGDTTPAKLIKAMSTATVDTPAGQYTMSPYKSAFTGAGNYHIM